MSVLANTTVRLTQAKARSQSASDDVVVPRSVSARASTSSSTRLAPVVCGSSRIFRTEYPDFSSLEKFPAVPRAARLGEPGATGPQLPDIYSESSLLSLLSQSVIARSDLLNFESLAGRLAMISFALAVGLELTQGHSFFSTENEPLLLASSGGIAATVLALSLQSDTTRKWLLNSTQFLLPPEDSLTETMLELVLEDISLDTVQD